MDERLPPLRIPAELLPSDGRFGSGPSKVRGAAVAALADAAPAYLGTSHRQEPVRRKVRQLREGLSTLFSLPDGYEVMLGVGGATAFWDAMAFGLVEKKSQHLVFGEFSTKCARAIAAAPHLQEPEVVESDPGTRPHSRPSTEVDLYALTHNETSTGVSMPVARPDDGAFVAVDATSAAAGLRVDASDFDVYYFSPQKGLAADAGLWLALCSPAAIDRIGKIAASGRYIPPSLDLQVALDNSRKDQTYNTPGLASIFLMVEQVDWMLESGGLEWATSRCDRSAQILYDWAEDRAYASPFVRDPASRSHVVGTIDLHESVDGGQVAKILRANGIVDTEPYRKLGRNQLRIAMYPAIDPDDIAQLTRCIDFVAEALLA